MQRHVPPISTSILLFHFYLCKCLRTCDSLSLSVHQSLRRFLPGGTKMHTNFLHKLFEHPQGSGTSRQNFRDIPDSSLQNPRQTNFRGRARTFRPPPLHVEDPHPTGPSPDPKVIFFCALFSCLITGRCLFSPVLLCRPGMARRAHMGTNKKRQKQIS